MEDTLYARYAPRLQAYFRRQGIRSDLIDDGVQDSFCGLVEAWARRRPIAATGPYLFAIAKRVAAALHREAAHRTHIPQEVSHGRSPDSLAEAREFCDLLSKAIEGLPDGERAVFRLRVDQDLSYPKIADRLGISRNAVAGRMFRARRRLLARLRIDSPGRRPGC